MIHRKLQNVVYMKKKSMFIKKKRGGGNIGSCPQVPVLVTSKKGNQEVSKGSVDLLVIIFSYLIF